MAPAGLDKLPQELMDNVIEHLRNDGQALSRLSKTCRIIHQQTILALYSNITMKWEGNAHKIDSLIKDPRALESSGSYPTVKTTTCPRVDLLLRTILDKPNLGHQVSTLDLRTTGFLLLRHSRPERETRNVPTLPDIKSLPDTYKDVIQEMGLDNTHQWEHAVDTNNIHAVISLLITRCPNLVSLTLGLALLYYNDFLPQVLERLFPIRMPNETGPHHPSLLKLETVNLGKMEDNDYSREQRLASNSLFSHYWCEGYPELGLYQPIFRCPSVSTITLRSHTKWIGGRGPIKNPSPRALKALRIPEEDIEPYHIREILENAPALERLDYTFWCQDSFEDGDESPNAVICEDFSHSLAIARKTLTHLRLSCEISPDDRNDDQFGRRWEAQEDFCSFSRLTSVRFLQTSLNLVFGDIPPGIRRRRLRHVMPLLWSRLPPNLEHWVVTVDRWTRDYHTRWIHPARFTEALQFLFEGKCFGAEWRSYTPNLRRLDFETSSPNVNATDESWEDLRRICISAGLECNLLESVEVDWI